MIARSARVLAWCVVLCATGWAQESARDPVRGSWTLRTKEAQRWEVTAGLERALEVRMRQRDADAASDEFEQEAFEEERTRDYEWALDQVAHQRDALVDCLAAELLPDDLRPVAMEALARGGPDAEVETLLAVARRLQLGTPGLIVDRLAHISVQDATGRAEGLLLDLLEAGIAAGATERFVGLLATGGKERSLQSLVGLLVDESSTPTSRHEVGRALAAIAGRGHRAALTRLCLSWLERVTDAERRAALFSALGEGDETALDVLARPVREWAFAPGSTPVDVRAAALALGKIGTADAIQTLIEVVEGSEDPAVEAVCVEALGHARIGVDDAQLVDYLVNRLELHERVGRDKALRATIGAALRRVTGERFASISTLWRGYAERRAAAAEADGDAVDEE